MRRDLAFYPIFYSEFHSANAQISKFFDNRDGERASSVDLGCDILFSTRDKNATCLVWEETMPSPLLQEERSIANDASRFDHWCQKFRHQVALIAGLIVLGCLLGISLITLI